jgi:hypothetical protein
MNYRAPISIFVQWKISHVCLGLRQHPAQGDNFMGMNENAG